MGSGVRIPPPRLTSLFTWKLSEKIEKHLKKSVDKLLEICYHLNCCRGVAQFGSARGLGPWGRGFESLRPDTFLLTLRV